MASPRRPYVKVPIALRHNRKLGLKFKGLLLNIQGEMAARWSTLRLSAEAACVLKLDNGEAMELAELNSVNHARRMFAELAERLLEARADRELPGTSPGTSREPDAVRPAVSSGHLTVELTRSGVILTWPDFVDYQGFRDRVLTRTSGEVREAERPNLGTSSASASASKNQSAVRVSDRRDRKGPKRAPTGFNAEELAALAQIEDARRKRDARFGAAPLLEPEGPVPTTSELGPEAREALRKSGGWVGSMLGGAS